MNLGDSKKIKWVFLSGVFILAATVLGLGLRFGLPMWLVDDEPPFPLAALKMVQLQTLVPQWHYDEFRPFLYYPVYLSYIYLPLFLAVLAGKFLFFNGTTQQFTYLIASDPSIFFWLARVMVATFSLISLAIFYKVVRRILPDPSLAILSVFLVGTSVSYLALSMTSRHWAPVIFIFILVLYFLTRADLGWRRRYLLATLTLGLGVGIGVSSAVGVLILPLWYLFYEGRTVKAAATDIFTYGLIGLFVALVVLPGFIYSHSYGFSGNVGFFVGKTLGGLLTSPVIFLKPLVWLEPALMLLAAIGAVVAIDKRRPFAAPLFIFIILYSGVFYAFFYMTHRFASPLIPFLAIFAAYGVGWWWEASGRWWQANSGAGVWQLVKVLARATLVLILLLPVLSALRLGYLVYRDDSRVLARQWAEKNLSADSKIIVLAPRLRLSSRPAAVEELRKIDAGAIRKVDEAESQLEGGLYYPSFHALNLGTVTDAAFIKNLENYARQHQYQYLIIAPNDDFGPQAAINSWPSDELVLLKSFGSEAGVRMPAAEVYKWSALDLWRIKEFGPKVSIYRLATSV